MLAAPTILTVTTAKDSLQHFRRFVQANVANGVDHMLVLDEGDSASRDPEWARGKPVTVIPANDFWLKEHSNRPPHLNTRQVIFANACRVTAAHLLPDSWLFHIDADEVLYLERDKLGEAASDISAIRLAPWEAVSTFHDQANGWFKKPIGREDLILLQTLGLISEPSLRAYFHGHVGGKSGLKVGNDALHLSIHKVVDDQRAPVESFQAPWLRVLHLESPNFAAFSAKWQALLTSGPSVKVRATREAQVAALERLLEMKLSSDTYTKYLKRLYEVTTADDFDTLKDLKLVERIDYLQVRYRSRPLDPKILEGWQSMLQRLANWEGKMNLRPGGDKQAVRALLRS